MRFRLMLDVEVMELLQSLPRRRRRKLFEHFRQLQESPDEGSDYNEPDSAGRRLDVSVFDGFAIHYWIDHADRMIKVLEMTNAD